VPLYTVTTESGTLNTAAKAELADQLTTLHCEFSGVPRHWVHVVFQDYAVGSGFTAGGSAATVALGVQAGATEATLESAAECHRCGR